MECYLVDQIPSVVLLEMGASEWRQDGSLPSLNQKFLGIFALEPVAYFCSGRLLPN